MALAIPKFTASGEVIYGETPEDGIIAKVYGDPELAELFAGAPTMAAELETLRAQNEKLLEACKDALVWAIEAKSSILMGAKPGKFTFERLDAIQGSAKSAIDAATKVQP